MIPSFTFERNFPERLNLVKQRSENDIFLDATIFLAKHFVSFLIIIFYIGFLRTEKKYVNVIDNYICNRKIEFKALNEIMKKNRDCKEVDKKIWRFVKCKEIVALRDFLNKF